MAITVSQAAAERIAELREDQDIDAGIPIRVGVVGGGCSGLTYTIDFDKEPEDPKRRDQVFEDNGIQLVVDMRSFLYLAGTQLDFSDGLQGKGFHFNNPNASRTCSCGESFAV
jgi:iron-sulfur cluster assembly protein